MYEHILQKIGLSQSEIQVYEALLGVGEAEVAQLMEPTGLSRTNLYNVLESLKTKELVVEVDIKKKKAYRPAPPEILRTIAIQRDEQMHVIRKEIEGLMPTLNSQYTLSTEKPAVRYLEGAEGVEEAANAILESTSVVYTFLDVDWTLKRASDLNRRHVEQRLKKGIVKRIIVANVTDEARTYIHNNKSELTQFRILGDEIAPFKTALEVYDDEISILNFGDNPVGILMKDPHIASLVRTLFEGLWNRLDEI